MNFKPMLAASLDGVDLSTLRYPLLVSPKLDGVRCIIWEGVAYSRNAKPIRNRFVQAWASKYHNLDGELIVGSPTEGEILGRTQSGVMSFEGEPDFTYHLFDCPDHGGPFESRLEMVSEEMAGAPRIVPVEHQLVSSSPALELLEEARLAEGYEGVMLRGPNGPYKNGRSTLREGHLMKLKRFMDGEAVVVRLEEGNVNDNELERDELGRAKRSKDASGLVPSGMVGTIIAVDPTWGELRISPGTMSHADRQAYWRAYEFELALGGNQCRVKGADEPKLIGKTIHWRSFGYGLKDKPRFARFYGIREDL